ncbi:MAG: cbb3-type cytochrome c oxidase N-terminal domain-containing protein [Bradymonadaceae bacterium]
MADNVEQNHTPGPTPDDDWDDELIPDHEYDGIHEYDNPIPGWLSLLFWATIIWSLFYVVAINLGYIDGFMESFEEGREEIAMKRAAAEQNSKKVGPETLSSAVGKSGRVEQGKKVFKGKCAACHQENGGGDVGPNLTDDYWLHGGELMAIYETISGGVTDKGMPAWKGRLAPKEIVSVVAYIRSIRGTDPANAEDPRGEKYVPGQ